MKIAAFLLIVFSGFFLNVTPTSPIYITFICAACIIIYKIGKRKKVIVNKYIKVLLCFLSYVFLIYFVFLNNVTNTTYNIVFSLSYGILTTLAIQEINTRDIIKYCIYSFRFATVLLAIEAVWRWTHPVWEQVLSDNDILYYQYKRSSIMYADSNFVGVYALALYFFVLYIQKVANVNLKKYRILFSVFVILTLSKAACLILFFSYVFSLKKISFGVKVSGFAIVLGATIVPIFNQVLRDGSLMGKIHIIDNAIIYFQQASIQNRMFGIGFGHLGELKFASGHNLIVTFLIESGIVGLIMLFGTWIVILIITKYKGLIVLGPFFFVSMSMAPHAIPYIYEMLAVVYVLTIRFQEEGEFFYQIPKKGVTMRWRK